MNRPDATEKHEPLNRSISVIVPSYNEEQNLEAALDHVVAACKDLPDGYEIIVVNDCSSDNTLAVAKKYAEGRPQVRIIDNKVNLGFGGAFREGLLNAKMSYSVMVCGDNCIGRIELGKILSRTGEYDVVVPYIANSEVRSFPRRLLSTSFVKLMNLLFRLDLKYYNGHNVFPTKAVNAESLSPGFAFAAEILVRLLKNGYTYCQVPMVVQPRINGETKAFKIKNIVSVLKSIATLFLEVYFSKRAGGSSNGKKAFTSKKGSKGGLGGASDDIYPLF
ncbi:MAG: glycosyltransferase family 2 protein [Bdellovibrionota bacterium]